jgi:hypothetical protein
VFDSRRSTSRLGYWNRLLLTSEMFRISL